MKCLLGLFVFAVRHAWNVQNMNPVQIAQVSYFVHFTRLFPFKLKKNHQSYLISSYMLSVFKGSYAYLQYYISETFLIMHVKILKSNGCIMW